MSEPELFYDAYDTQVGVVGILAGPAGLRRLGWGLEPGSASREPDETVQLVLGQLREYFAGQRGDFDVPLDLPPLEPTTLAVLLALKATRAGETVTYDELARRSGTGVPARAVGSIMAANPVPLVIPCHRVVAADGLGGFSGGDPGHELETKRWLLENEGAMPPVLVWALSYAAPMDICELILSDHHEQRRMFAMLDDVAKDDTHTLDVLWKRLSTMLEVHAQGEEELFYPELLKLGERLHTDAEVEETEDAIGDHNDIRDGILASQAADVGSDAWWKGVNDAREANDEHMGEEEHEGLKDFREHVDLETRHRIGLAFAAYEAEHIDGVPIVDKDPEQYVKENS